MNKGFTLIELLAVLLILGLLVILVVPAVTNVINHSRIRLYNMQITNIELAAKNWGAENINLLPTENGASITIYLYNLKMGGFIEGDIVNPLTGELFPNDMLIEIKRVVNSYQYKVLEETGTSNGEFDYNSLTVILLGGLEDEVEINGDFTGVSASDIIAYAPDGSLLDSSNIAITITLNGTVVGSIDISSLDEYQVEYIVSYEGLSETINRQIAVVDTIPPELIVPEETTISQAACAAFDPEDGILVSDNSGSYTLDINGTLNCGTTGSNILEYVATDPSNNQTIKERNVIVE